MCACVFVYVSVGGGSSGWTPTVWRRKWLPGLPTLPTSQVSPLGQQIVCDQLHCFRFEKLFTHGKSTCCCQSCSRQWPMIFVNFDNAALSQCSDMYVCKVIQGPGDGEREQHGLGPMAWVVKGPGGWGQRFEKKTFQLKVELWGKNVNRWTAWFEATTEESELHIDCGLWQMTRLAVCPRFEWCVCASDGFGGTNLELIWKSWPACGIVGAMEPSTTFHHPRPPRYNSDHLQPPWTLIFFLSIAIKFLLIFSLCASLYSYAWNSDIRWSIRDTWYSHNSCPQYETFCWEWGFSVRIWSGKEGFAAIDTIWNWPIVLRGAMARAYYLILVPLWPFPMSPGSNSLDACWCIQHLKPGKMMKKST